LQSVRAEQTAAARLKPLTAFKLRLAVFIPRLVAAMARQHLGQAYCLSAVPAALAGVDTLAFQTKGLLCNLLNLALTLDLVLPEQVATLGHARGAVLVLLRSPQTTLLNPKAVLVNSQPNFRHMELIQATAPRHLRAKGILPLAAAERLLFSQAVAVAAAVTTTLAFHTPGCQTQAVAAAAVSHWRLAALVLLSSVI